MRSKKRKNQTKKKGKLFIYIGIILVLFSVSFLLYQKYKLHSMKDKATSLESLLVKNQAKNNKAKSDKQSGGEKTGSETIDETSIQGEVGEIYSSAIGVIRIDKIGVVLPIVEDTKIKSLKDGAGVLEGTDLPSSNENTVTVLAGHRGGRNEEQTFLKIDKLKDGDEIKITTKEEVLHYKVVGREIIEPTDWSKFTRQEGKTRLILMTCHPYPQNYQRLLVKAELIKDVENIEEN